MNQYSGKTMSLLTDAGTYQVTFSFQCEGVGDNYVLSVMVNIPTELGMSRSIIDPLFVNSSKKLCGEPLARNWEPTPYDVKTFSCLPSVDQLQVATNNYMSGVLNFLEKIVNTNYTLKSRLDKALGNN